MSVRPTDVMHETAPIAGSSTSTPARPRKARRTAATLVAALGLGLVPAVGTATAHAAPATTGTTSTSPVAAKATTTARTSLTVKRSTATTYEGRQGARLPPGWAHVCPGPGAEVGPTGTKTSLRRSRT